MDWYQVTVLRAKKIEFVTENSNCEYTFTLNNCWCLKRLELFDKSLGNHY
jgi:hypothetical protein